MNTVLVGKDNINEIVELLCKDEVVAFPTETVFGLGVRYGSFDALEKLYELKHRSKNKAITLMVNDIKDIDKFGYVNNQAKKIIEAFMPGMITIILKKKAVVDNRYTSGLETIGIRIPDDPFVLELLKQVGPMLVTSANISGEPALLCHQEVLNIFDGKIKMIVEGNCVTNQPSSVVDLSKGSYEILRKGDISKEQIEEVLK